MEIPYNDVSSVVEVLKTVEDIKLNVVIRFLQNKLKEECDGE